MADEILTEGEAEALFQQVVTCKPVVPPESMETVADMVRSNEAMGRPWRLAAVIGSKDGSFFQTIADEEDTAKTMVEAMVPLQDFAKRLREMADVADAAAARIMVAACAHQDFPQWLRGAEGAQHA